jgi:hypothetical protein
MEGPKARKTETTTFNLTSTRKGGRLPLGTSRGKGIYFIKYHLMIFKSGRKHRPLSRQEGKYPPISLEERRKIRHTMGRKGSYLQTWNGRKDLPGYIFVRHRNIVLT